jgi:hypothetical protein
MPSFRRAAVSCRRFGSAQPGRCPIAAPCVAAYVLTAGHCLGCSFCGVGSDDREAITCWGKWRSGL